MDKESSVSCANTLTPKRLNGGGGAPELQEAVNLPLSPWALKRGWALDGELQRRPRLRQPMPATGKCWLGPWSGCSPGRLTDLAIVLLRKLAVAPQAYESPKVLAWGQGPTFLWSQISPAVPPRILPDKY